MKLRPDGRPLRNNEDITGKRFGRLVAVECVRKVGNAHTWLFACDCGAKKLIAKRDVVTGKTASCTCLRTEQQRAPKDPATHSQYTHGRHETVEYHAWRSLIQRCHSPQPGLSRYRRYSGRGIRVCDRWTSSFENFFSDMGPRPSAEHSIDRIDNDGDYEPQNCRWATRREQAQNRDTTRLLQFKGETKCVAEWERALGLRPGLVSARLRAGWATEDALTRKPRRTLASAEGER